MHKRRPPLAISYAYGETAEGQPGYEIDDEMLSRRESRQDGSKQKDRRCSAPENTTGKEHEKERRCHVQVRKSIRKADQPDCLRRLHRQIMIRRSQRTNSL